MASKFQPSLENLETRNMMSASPLAGTAYTYAKDAMTNYYNLSHLVALTNTQLHSYGASSLHSILEENLTASQRKMANAAEANLQRLENQYYQSEAKLENYMVQLRKEESTIYKNYNHTNFNQNLAAFNAYDKAFWNEMIALETLM